MSHVLIVDDEPAICWSFREFLTDEGHEVSIAPSAEDAFKLTAKNKPDAVVLDVRLPGMDGLSAIKQLRQIIGSVPIIVITAFGNLETAVKAIAEGAFDYLPKPFDLDRATAVIQRALDSRTATEASDANTAKAANGEPHTSLVGTSRAMQEVFKQIALVAATDVPVLITGESGTGKELVARAIHRHSRREGPFLPVCLAALSPSLVESELFGHVRGAFTGATEDRTGLLELAGDGTVLLDEIADISLGLQVKLLRALEQREITPVGSAKARSTRLRLLAATNRPLHELIASGEFREDLYFRLKVFQITLPPLRDRLEDIPPLTAHFLAQMGGHNATATEELLQELARRPWVGNVREMRNAVEHAVIVARGGRILPEHLPEPYPIHAASTASESPQISDSLSAWVQREMDRSPEPIYERFQELVEPALLRTVLEVCQQNRAAAAERLGMHRTTLRQKLRRYGISE